MVLLEHRQLQLLEEDGGELLRRVEVERPRRPPRRSRPPAAACRAPSSSPSRLKSARSIAMPSHSMSTSTSTSGSSMSRSSGSTGISLERAARRSRAARGRCRCRRRSRPRPRRRSTSANGISRLAPPRHVLVRLHRAAEVLEAERVDGVGAPARVEHEAREHRVVRDAARARRRRARSTCQSYLISCPALGTPGILEQLDGAARRRGP